ncbi:MAG: amino acid ABC transporter substrate-binding protein [Snowella sp.]|jgi:polar amino acid transport system substrate-binding protein|nr:MAG: amino acid ABC transporter substrate-binding protein [Snowella sp.]
MFKKLSIPLLSLLLILTGTKATLAETVMEKVARTGVLTLGINSELIPYSYVNDKGELDGYSMSIVNLVRQQLEKELGKPVTLETVEAKTIADRIPKLLTGEIDIACDTAFTWTRDKYVDFSVSYSITGIRLLVPKNSNLDAPESLIDKRIAVIPNSVGEKAIKLAQPKAKLVPVENIEAGLIALKEGKVDGVAGDSILLDGARQKAGLLDTKLVPQTPFASYGVACMIGQHDPTFLRLVNFSIVGFMENYLAQEKTASGIVDRWLGPNGITIVDPDVIRSFFNYTVITHEQIPPAETK